LEAAHETELRTEVERRMASDKEAKVLKDRVWSLEETVASLQVALRDATQQLQGACMLSYPSYLYKFTST
jgi:hypothetical protein